MLAFLFIFWVNLCGNTRISCLPFFSVSGSIFLVTQGDRVCLSFYFIGRYSWARKEIVLALLLCSGSIFVGTQGDCACLYFLFLGRSLFYYVLVRFFPVGTRDWRVCSSSALWVGLSVPLFSRMGQLLLYCQHMKSRVIKSLSRIYAKSISCRFPVELWSCLSSVPFEQWF